MIGNIDVKITEEDPSRPTKAVPPNLPTSQNSNGYSGYLITVVVIVLMFFVYRYAFNSKPSADEIRPALENYLSSQVDQRCADGTEKMTVSTITNIHVGRFIKQIQAYPIFANYEMGCLTSEGELYTASFGRPYISSEKVVIAYTKEENGAYVVFVPHFMQQMYNNEIDNINSQLKQKSDEGLQEFNEEF